MSSPSKMLDCSVIIPCVRVNKLLLECVDGCLTHFPTAKVVVLLDDPDTENLLTGVETVITGPVTIARKRNVGADCVSTTYIAFIDSDAVPDGGWLPNAIEILEENDAVTIAGGPDLPPPDEVGWPRLVGFASKSVAVSGSNNIRKFRASPRPREALPSCNMVLRRADYLELGGMDENLLTGEDIEFCFRVRERGGVIQYSPKVAVFHRDRELRPYVMQRLTYGASVPKLLARTPSIRKAYLLGPAFIVLYLASGALALVAPQYLWPYLAGVIALSLVLAAEAFRHAQRLIDVPGVFSLLTIGLLMPGVGTILSAVGVLPDVRRFYSNIPSGEDKRLTHGDRPVE